jgi:hypothetical protein
MKLGQRASLMALSMILAMGIASGAGAAWVNATGNLAGQPTECGDLQSIWAVPGMNKVITGVGGNGLYATTDGGTNWGKISGNVISVRLMEMRFDPDNPDTWYAGGIYHIPGICKTTNAGATWTALGTVGGNDGFAVDFSDPQRKTLLAGGHESSNTLFKSVDGGQTWNNIGGPGGGYSQFPYIINTQTFLMGIQNTGYFRSVNGGGAWTLISSTPPSTRLTRTSAGDLYYIGSNKVVRGSADGSTWTVLPAIAGVNLAGASPIEIPGGKIAVLTSDGISISADKGATWKSGCKSLPTQVKGFWAFGAILGLAYNSVAGAFYTFYWNCVFTNAAILPDEIWRFDTLVGSTDVVSPARTHVQLASMPGISENLQAFDVSGRVVHGSAADIMGTQRMNRVYFVKMPSGEIVKKLSVR